MRRIELSAAVAAIRENGFPFGQRVERKEIGAPGEFDPLTGDELERALRQRLVALGFRSDTDTQISSGKQPSRCATKCLLSGVKRT